MSNKQIRDADKKPPFRHDQQHDDRNRGRKHPPFCISSHSLIMLRGCGGNNQFSLRTATETQCGSHSCYVNGVKRPARGQAGAAVRSTVSLVAKMNSKVGPNSFRIAKSRATVSRRRSTGGPAAVASFATVF